MSREIKGVSLPIGFIGLGAMGLPMAINLCRAGFAVTVWNRTAARAEPLRALGAVAADAPCALGGLSVVCLNLADDAAVESVLWGAQGLGAQLARGSVVVDFGTTSLALTRACAARLAERGAAWVDAPVSGGVTGAESASLSIMAGADAAVFERVLPVLQTVGRQALRIGEVGAGQVAKACNQVVVSATLLGVAEALTLARRAGVDAARVREALLGGFAASRILEVHGQRMLDARFEPGFKAGLHRKDLNLVLEAARALDLPLPTTQQALHCLDALVAAGASELDSSALIRVVQAGVLQTSRASD